MSMSAWEKDEVSKVCRPRFLYPFTLQSRTHGLSIALYLYGQMIDLNPFTTFREAREAQERADYEANNPIIQQQFADLKRSLASVSEDDWANLPEAGDLTRKNKRTKTNAHNRFHTVPDSLIAKARDST